MMQMICPEFVDQTLAGQFSGPSTLRQARLLEALEIAPLTRREVDKVSGALNGPQIVLELRRRGLEIPCELIVVYDRDGNRRETGRYSLTPRDLEKMKQWRNAHGWA